MAILHLGTFDPDHLIELSGGRVQRCLGVPGSPSEWRFKDHGDDWDEWGEGRQSLTVPEHVITVGSVPDLLSDLAYLVGEGAALMPMTFQRQAGTVAVITRGDEDDTELYSLTSKWAAVRLAEIYRDRQWPDDHSVWSDPAWREFIGTPDSDD